MAIKIQQKGTMFGERHGGLMGVHNFFVDVMPRFRLSNLEKLQKFGERHGGLTEGMAHDFLFNCILQFRLAKLITITDFLEAARWFKGSWQIFV